MIIELIDAQLYNQDTILATVDKTTDDGQVVRMAHMIPRDAIEWRAAEYGIDPSETDTLLDIILHEPHIELDPELGLYQAPSREAAKTHLLEKVRARKAESDKGKSLRRVPAGGKGGVPDPRAKVLGLCHLDPEAVALKGAMVAHVAEKVRQEGLRRKPEKQEDRIGKLRDTLKEMKNATDAHNATRPRQA